MHPEWTTPRGVTRVTSDPEGARHIAEQARVVSHAVGYKSHADDQALVVHAPEEAIDDLVVRLVWAGIALRELGPVVPPLGPPTWR